MSEDLIFSLALPVPLRRFFDYLPPPDWDAESARRLLPGVRMEVNLGRRRGVVGILVASSQSSELPRERLKPVKRVLDNAPLLPEAVLELCRWAADYYHHPLGEILQYALPPLLRKGGAPRPPQPYWRRSEQQPEAPLPPRAIRQRQLLQLLRQRERVGAEELRAQGIPLAVAQALEAQGLLLRCAPPAEAAPQKKTRVSEPLVLNEEQAQVAAAVLAQKDTFSCSLLDGITGSGKTEIYAHLAEQLLAAGRQVLLLVPEIGLTPQTRRRLEKRLHWPLVVLHSGLRPAQRLQAWNMARSGAACVVLGTRSAIFTPLPKLGLIIVDEEHDPSFTQQDGFCYCARDLALVRAQQANIPVLLGSATPSLESLYNAQRQRFRHYRLRTRGGGALPPRLSILDIRRYKTPQGLAPPLVQAIDQHLGAGHQVLVYLDRRGFAPRLGCEPCRWIASCPDCELAYTLHITGGGMLHCHHCGGRHSVPASCPTCQGPLQPQGTGTQRVEQALANWFPSVPLLRVDGDSSPQGALMGEVLAHTQRAEPCLLVGTRLLAKGHDFPYLKLTAVVDADTVLLGPDFRSSERMGQIITQVAGRSGRRTDPGEAMIQTRLPHHPLLQLLCEKGYGVFAQRLLEERRRHGTPPFSNHVRIGADAPQQERVQAFLEQVAQRIRDLPGKSCRVVGPLPALHPRRAGRWRSYLLLSSLRRRPLHRVLDALCPHLEESGKTVRWSLQVDPREIY